MRRTGLVVFGIIMAVGAFVLTSGALAASKPSETPASEVAWIRNGEPISFEGENWYPTDEVENLLDNEVYAAGMYREVPFFLDKTDVKPFDRIYTRFAKNRYRAFERRD